MRSRYDALVVFSISCFWKCGMIVWILDNYFDDGIGVGVDVS